MPTRKTCTVMRNATLKSMNINRKRLQPELNHAVSSAVLGMRLSELIGSICLQMTPFARLHIQHIYYHGGVFVEGYEGLPQGVA